jgi:hypothetical protein
MVCLRNMCMDSLHKGYNDDDDDNNNNINIRGKSYWCLLISKTPGSRMSKCMHSRTECILNPGIRRKRVVIFRPRSKKPPRQELVWPQGQPTHTSEITNIKVQNIFHLQSNITCSTNCKYRTTATLCSLEIWFVSGI